MKNASWKFSDNMGLFGVPSRSEYYKTCTVGDTFWAPSSLLLTWFLCCSGGQFWACCQHLISGMQKHHCFSDSGLSLKPERAAQSARVQCECAQESDNGPWSPEWYPALASKEKKFEIHATDLFGESWVFSKSNELNNLPFYFVLQLLICVPSPSWSSLLLALISWKFLPRTLLHSLLWEEPTPWHRFFSLEHL